MKNSPTASGSTLVLYNLMLFLWSIGVQIMENCCWFLKQKASFLLWPHFVYTVCFQASSSLKSCRIGMIKAWGSDILPTYSSLNDPYVNTKFSVRVKCWVKGRVGRMSWNDFTYYQVDNIESLIVSAVPEILCMFNKCLTASHQEPWFEIISSAWS